MKADTPRLFAMALASMTAILALAGCQDPSLAVYELEFDGLNRQYRVHVPADYTGGTPVPLVVVLHGVGQTGADVKGLTEFNTVADAEGFIAVYPDAYEENWNDGRDVAGVAAYDLDVDDVGFILEVVDRLKAAYAIDGTRVYAAGMSNGGMMVYRLACEAPGAFAAMAAVAASIPENLYAVCAPASPMPIVIINGTDDPIVPHEGGTIYLNGADIGRVVSVDAAVAFWVNANPAADTPVSVTEPDADPGDGTRVYRDTYAAAAGGAEVVFYRVDGGGHTWPGGPALFQPGLGAVSNDIDASSVIWDFFAGHAAK